ncbi:MAG: hypothetical protein WBE75_05040 [Candidatus Omnitrophota bacterium]|jgi:chromosome segregation ATPase
MIKLRKALVAFLVGAGLVSIVHYSFLLQEKTRLSRALEEMNARVSILEKDKAQMVQSLNSGRDALKKLDEDNARLGQTIQSQGENISALTAEVERTNGKLEELNSRYSLLRCENSALRSQLFFVVKEEEKMRLNMTSLPELKKAIRELKKKKTHASVLPVIHKQRINKVVKGQILEGNKGFLVRDGKPTFAKTIKIEVVPTPSQ